MGEIEKTLERLNKVLIEAGFAKAGMNNIYQLSDGCWEMGTGISLRFDKDGRYIEPESGGYDIAALV